MLSQMRRVALTPVWIAQLASGTKSFDPRITNTDAAITMWSPKAADEFGVPFEQVNIVVGERVFDPATVYKK